MKMKPIMSKRPDAAKTALNTTAVMLISSGGLLAASSLDPFLLAKGVVMTLAGALCLWIARKIA